MSAEQIQQESIGDIIQQIRPLLPIQNPLNSFVHNNILMMFEHKHFHEGILEAGRLYQARAYQKESYYRKHFVSGRITNIDLRKSLGGFLKRNPDSVLSIQLPIDSENFYLNLLKKPLSTSHQSRVSVSAHKSMGNLELDLLPLCGSKVQSLQIYKRTDANLSLRLATFWEKKYGESVSQAIHPFLVKILSSFLDQGMGYWPNPFTQHGLWKFFSFYVKEVKRFSPEWIGLLAARLSKYEGQGTTVEGMIEAELQTTGIPRVLWKDYLLELLFDLKGWSGMINKLELEPHQAPVKAPNCKLLEYIALRVLVENSINAYLGEKNSLDPSLLRPEVGARGSYSPFVMSHSLYQIALGEHNPKKFLEAMNEQGCLELLEKAYSFSRIMRQQVWHEAYENHFYENVLDKFARHQSIQKEKSDKQETPNYQVLFCIDDREESIRRHLEELDPKVKTFGVVGFFGLDTYFVGLGHPRKVTQCPTVIKPGHVIFEKTAESHKSSLQKFQTANNLLGEIFLSTYFHTRTMFRGFLSSFLLGTFSFIPLTFKILNPNLSAAIRKGIWSYLFPSPKTEMVIESELVKGHMEGGPSSDAFSHMQGGPQGPLEVGYTKAQMAAIVSTILKMCGITKEFAPLIVPMAHGSTNTNNPFRQAYGCGACSGNPGHPNSRAFCYMANKPEVRKIVREEFKIDIPDSTYFLAAYHDTCSDDIQFYDLEILPAQHQDNLKLLRSNLREASILNAYERCQRFSAFTPTKNIRKAFEHVKERSEDLAQPRPEYGHSGVALAIVGRRELTEGFFMNRRSFLVSYDPTIDPDGKILADVMIGAVPVCANINLDYYFSAVDNAHFGAGSKLPLNVTSLLGVMTGSCSDLRIGLARQMVEIHEPMRILVLIEANQAILEKTIRNHPRLKNLTDHFWMRLGVIDPQTRGVKLFTEDGFVPYEPRETVIEQFPSSRKYLEKYWDGKMTKDDFALIGGKRHG